MTGLADRVAILIAVLMALFIAVLLLPAIAFMYLPESVRSYLGQRQEPPVHTVSRKEAQAIALAEVKKREGWSGAADEPTGYYLFCRVVVRRKQGPNEDCRQVTINCDQTIVGYEAWTEPAQ
jgi:hypothetical protein